MPKDEKDKKIEETIKELQKKYGDDSVIKGKEILVETIDTGCVSLNHVLACGGFPRGRIIEAYGMESAGKSLLALFIAAQVQKNGGRVFWIDAEFCFNTDYAEKIGVDIKNLIIHKPMNAEEGFDALEKMIKTNSVDLIVVDSVAALVPQEELDGEIGDKKIALQARLLSKGLRAITGMLSQTKTSVIFINQLRDNLMTFGYGQKNTTPGGRALKFYASIRLSVRKGKKILNSKKEIVGNELIIKAEKNKVGLPFRETTLDLFFAKGIDTIGDLINFAIQNNIIQKEGNTYSFGDVKLGVGLEKVKEYVRQDKKLVEEIKKLILKI